MAITAGRRHPWKQALSHFLAKLKWPIIVCVGLAFAYVVVLTTIHKSGNGPLVFIFYGPAALAIGILMGTIIWLITPLKPDIANHLKAGEYPN